MLKIAVFGTKNVPSDVAGLHKMNATQKNRKSKYVLCYVTFSYSTFTYLLIAKYIVILSKRSLQKDLN